MAQPHLPGTEIFDGGPPFRLERSLRLIKPNQRRSMQRAILAVLIVWAPLFVLSAIEMRDSGEGRAQAVAPLRPARLALLKRNRLDPLVANFKPEQSTRAFWRRRNSTRQQRCNPSSLYWDGIAYTGLIGLLAIAAASGESTGASQ